MISPKSDILELYIGDNTINQGVQMKGFPVLLDKEASKRNLNMCKYKYLQFFKTEI